MPEPKLIVYKGPSSQTGIAASKELSDISSQWKNAKYWEGKTFDQIKNDLLKDKILAVLPMWNSHKGELRFTYVLEMIFQKHVVLFSIFPNPIVFECIVKKDIKLKDIKKITSVHVAEDQCSQFLKKINAIFMPEESTIDAVRNFKNPEIQAALLAPGQNDGYNTLICNAENPINFTSFALLGSLDSYHWTDNNWGSFFKKIKNVSRVYFGAQMPIRSVAFSDDQKALFNELTYEAESINDIPKILFVTQRTSSQCGLLIEATNEILPDEILTEEGDTTEIEIIQDIGKSYSSYNEKVYNVLQNNYSSDIKHDFIRHKGEKNNTCFFACLPLEIIMHGFEDNVVEPVMRLLIGKYFELYNNGITCTNAQKKFFRKYNKEYLKYGMDFIKFVDIGTTA